MVLAVLFCAEEGFEQLNAARVSAAGEGWTEPNLYFLSCCERKCKRIRPPLPYRIRKTALGDDPAGKKTFIKT